MQNYAQIDDIDHYSLHKIFIISVINTYYYFQEIQGNVI